MTEIGQDIKLEPKEEIEEKETKLAEATRTMTTSRRAGKRGRKPAKIDVKAKLERSRQSARECRARKKLRYQYLEELVSSREKAIFSLRRELEACKKWTQRLDSGTIPPGLLDVLHQEHKAGLHQPHQLTRTTNWCQIVTDDDDEETDDEQVEVVELGEPAVQSKPRKRTTSERKTSESSVKSGRSRKRQASESSVTSHGLRTQTILKMFAGAKSDHSEASPGVNHSFSSTSSPYAIDTPSFDTVNTSLDVSGVSESAQNSGQFSTIDTSALNLGEAVAGTSSSVENDENSGLGSSLIDILSETQMKSLLESIEKGVWQ